MKTVSWLDSRIYKLERCLSLCSFGFPTKFHVSFAHMRIKNETKTCWKLKFNKLFIELQKAHPTRSSTEMCERSVIINAVQL